MIKFLCAGCEKKIAVPGEFAGRLVRCPRCRQPARVPQNGAQQVGQDNCVAPAEDPPRSDGADMAAEGGQIPVEKVAAANVVEALLDGIEETQNKGLRCPRCNAPVNPKSEFCVECGWEAPVREDWAGAGGRYINMRVRRREPDPQDPPLTIRLPQALIGGGITATLGAILWAFLTYFGLDIRYGAVGCGIGAVVGVAVSHAAKREHYLYGLLAVALTLAGMLTGKLLAVNWSFGWELKQMEFYVRPYAQAVAQSGQTMFDIACMQLSEEGAIGEDWIYLSAYYRQRVAPAELTADTRLTMILLAKQMAQEMPEFAPFLSMVAQTDFGIELEPLTLPEDRLEEFDRDMKLVLNRRDGWSPVERQEKVTAMFVQQVRQFVETVPYWTKLRKSMRSLDALWCVLAVASAYKLGEGALL